MAYFDDVTVICRFERVRTVITIIDGELAVNIHYGKTQVWNRGGVAPEVIDEFTRLARLVKPEAVVWRGDTQLPVEGQGVRLLGVPIGSPCVRQQLEDKSAEQDLLFHRIPLMEDTQVCWLLLFMCAATRANFWLRAVHPDQSESFAVRHDSNVWRCMRAQSREWKESLVLLRRCRNCHSRWEG